MPKTIEAVHENGVLRTLVTLALANAQDVQVTIADVDTDVAAYFDAAEWEASKHDDLSLQEVRAALSSMDGSLADVVVASRDEHF